MSVKVVTSSAAAVVAGASLAVVCLLGFTSALAQDRIPSPLTTSLDSPDQPAPYGRR